MLLPLAKQAGLTSPDIPVIPMEHNMSPEERRRVEDELRRREQALAKKASLIQSKKGELAASERKLADKRNALVFATKISHNVIVIDICGNSTRILRLASLFFTVQPSLIHIYGI